MTDNQDKVYLYSRLEHPVYLAYGSGTITIPPKARKIRVRENKLGDIPKGIVKRKQ